MTRNVPYRGGSLMGAVTDFLLVSGLQPSDEEETGRPEEMVLLRARGPATLETLGDRWASGLFARERSYHTVSQEDGLLVLRFVTSGG